MMKSDFKTKGEQCQEKTEGETLMPFGSSVQIRESSSVRHVLDFECNRQRAVIESEAARSATFNWRNAFPQNFQDSWVGSCSRTSLALSWSIGVSDSLAFD